MACWNKLLKLQIARMGGQGFQKFPVPDSVTKCEEIYLEATTSSLGADRVSLFQPSIGPDVS